MLNDEINKKREELDNSIAEQREYAIIYKLSIELDDLIAEHYRRNATPKKKSKNIKMRALI